MSRAYHGMSGYAALTRPTYYVLDRAILQHKANPEKFAVESVIEAKIKGEEIIGGGTQPSIKGKESPSGSAATKRNEPK